MNKRATCIILFTIMNSLSVAAANEEINEITRSMQHVHLENTHTQAYIQELLYYKAQFELACSNMAQALNQYNIQEETPQVLQLMYYYTNTHDRLTEINATLSAYGYH